MPNYLTHSERPNAVPVGKNLGMNTNLIRKNLTEDSKILGLGERGIQSVDMLIEAYGYKAGDAAGPAGGTVGGYIHHVNRDALIQAIVQQKSVIEVLENETNDLQIQLQTMKPSDPRYTDLTSKLITNQYLLGMVYECEGEQAKEANNTGQANKFFGASQKAFEGANQTYSANRNLYKKPEETKEWMTNGGKNIWTRRGTPDTECSLKIGQLKAKVAETAPPVASRFKNLFK